MSLLDWAAWQAAITLDDTVAPVIHPPRRVPYSLLDKLKKKLRSSRGKTLFRKWTDPVLGLTVWSL